MNKGNYKTDFAVRRRAAPPTVLGQRYSAEPTSAERPGAHGAAHTTILRTAT